MSREPPGWEIGTGQPPRGFTALPSFRVHILARLLERHSDRWFQARFGMTLPEIRVIAITGSARRATLKHLCQEAELDRGQASRLVTRLAERGLIARLEHPQDQRSAVLALTAEGERLFPTLLAAATERNEDWLSVLPAAAQAELMQQVDLLIAQLRRGIETEAPPDPAPPLAADVEPAEPDSIAIDIATARRLRDLLNLALGDAPD